MGFSGAAIVTEVIRTEVEEIAWNNQQAGVGISQYDVIFQDGSYWKKADAWDPNTVPSRGIAMAQDTVDSGATGLDVWIRGLITNSAWSLVSGARVFLASGGGTTSGGAISMSGQESSGAVALTLGRALTLTTMEFNPGEPIQIS